MNTAEDKICETCRYWSELVVRSCGPKPSLEAMTRICQKELMPTTLRGRVALEQTAPIRRMRHRSEVCQAGVEDLVQEKLGKLLELKYQRTFDRAGVPQNREVGAGPVRKRPSTFPRALLSLKLSRGPAHVRRRSCSANCRC